MFKNLKTHATAVRYNVVCNRFHDNLLLVHIAVLCVVVSVVE